MGKSGSDNSAIEAPFMLATSMARRFKGLLGHAPCEGILLLAPCKDIHTFGMKDALDIAFIDDAGVVLSAYRNVTPRHRLACSHASAVLERFAKGAAAWVEPGDRVGLTILTNNEEGLI